MTVETFSVVADDVRAGYFPNWSAFSATTKPTSTQVAVFISEEAADLAGHLAVEDVTVSSSNPAASSAALAWCQKTLRLAVAIRVMRASTAQNPEVAKAWQEELDSRYKMLERMGATVMGAGAAESTSTSPVQGPTTHIGQYGLTTADVGLMSTVEPRLRRDDEL